jgi:hypothetical protein
VKDLYNEICKPLKKELEKTTDDRRISHTHGLAESML